MSRSGRSAASTAAISLLFMLSACITTEETASVDSVAELRTESAPGIASIREVPRYRLPFEDNPDRLQGLSDRQMTSIFGEPGFRRKDKPAEVWRYRSPGCILDVFLYPEGKDYRVAHAEVREAAAEKTPSHCLTSIVDQRNS